MEHARSVLHLFPSCVALENKFETVNETRNREQWRYAFYDNMKPCTTILFTVIRNVQVKRWIVENQQHNKHVHFSSFKRKCILIFFQNEVIFIQLDELDIITDA